MKVLFVFYVPSGGVETLNRQRCKALQAAGLTCHLLYLQKGTGLQNVAAIPTFITNQEDEIGRIIDKERYTAIVISSASEYLARFRSLGYKGLLLWEVQGYASMGEAQLAVARARPLIMQYGDGVLYPETPYIMRLAEAYFPMAKRFCFHDCIDFSNFRYQQLPQEPAPILGWVGRLEPNKNWQDFLRIGRRLKDSVPDLRLWMFEDPTLSRAGERLLFRQMLTQLQLDNCLSLHASIPHARMQDYYSRIANSGGLLCSTSKLEGFGYAVLEAICCRCPVLATDSDGIRSFIIHNETGKFYGHGDIEEAVREAQELMQNTALRTRLTEQALQHAKSLFSPEIYSRNFLQMLTVLQTQKR